MNHRRYTDNIVLINDNTGELQGITMELDIQASKIQLKMNYKMKIKTNHKKELVVKALQRKQKSQSTHILRKQKSG